uniref:helix-turn-helix domain-containing protein n=1 Tax=Dialister sp. TaxID=1955814 RepID=UPI0040260629
MDKNLKKKDLMNQCNISSASVAKLTKGENMTTDVLLRICEGLDCDFADIMQVIPDQEPGEKEA